MSLFQAADEKLPSVRDAEGNILTQNFLDICKLVLPVVDKFGAAFAIVRNDIQGNIDRLAARYATDPGRFTQLFEIVRDEVARKETDHSRSCTKGLLWLKRAMEFTTGIVQRLQTGGDSSLSAIVAQVYAATLQPYHGWIASSAFTVAFKFVPSREALMEQVSGGCSPAVLAADMAAFTSRFGEVLGQVHKFLDDNGLNDPTKV